jgi:hypothetical protein
MLYTALEKVPFWHHHRQKLIIKKNFDDELLEVHRQNA